MSDTAVRRRGRGAPKIAGSDAGDLLTGGLTPYWSVVVLLVVVLAGALFGYDQGVIAGALLGIEQDFKLGALALALVTSWVTLGALFGSLAGGFSADRYGRKASIITAAVLFIAGALIEAFAPDTAILIVGRFVVGFGVGVAAVAAPLYAAELAPARLRGRFISSYQLAITIGIFLSYLINEILSGPDHWRLMLGISAVPGLLLLLATIPAARSPRWLLMVGRTDDARSVLEQLTPGGEKVDEAQLQALSASLKAEAAGSSWGEVFARRWRRPLEVGLGLAVLQQVTGINAIIFYSNRIFASAGFESAASQAHATTWAIGAVNVAATFIAIATIDHLGRRTLLLAGLIGMGVSLAAVGFAFMGAQNSGTTGVTSHSYLTLAALVVFIISFAFSLGPVTWTVINEVYPGRVRGRAVSIATAVNWGAAFLVSGSFLSFVNALGEPVCFWIFAAFCALGFVWVYFRVPETRGRTLEEIQTHWEAGS